MKPFPNDSPTSQNQFFAVEDRIREYLQNLKERKENSTGQLPIYNPFIFEEFSFQSASGLQMQVIENFYRIKLDGFGIDLARVNEYLHLINSQCFPHTIVELELLNLPIRQADSEAIGQIFRGQSNLKRLAVMNFTLNENVYKEQFYNNFTYLSLSHLKLKGCSGVEEILLRINGSLEALIPEDNEMYCNFDWLARLILLFTSLNCLVVNRNKIISFGFERFSVLCLISCSYQS